MRGRAYTAMALAAVISLGGCASSRVLVHTTTTAPAAATTSATGSSTAAYIAQLRAQERTLVAAERNIPTSATTAPQLAHSATLLSSAVSRLATGLAAIKPPPTVVRSHAQLVAIARAYAARLGSAAGLAQRPGGRVSAGNLLISATNQASAAFGATLSRIYTTLGVAQQ